MMLRVEELSAAYGRDEVLRGLTLDVPDGAFVSLLGPSGCGKSTLLKTIAGIVPAAGGRILLGGQEITNLPIHQRGTVVLFQDMRLFPHMSVMENVSFPLKMQGVGKAERLRRAEELLDQVGMAWAGRRLPAALSGGQQQRVALARVLAAEPRVLLLDEPFSALDENLREEMRELVLRLHRRFSMTTVLVTHDRGEALSMSDRVAVMFDGQIAQEGTPKEVYDRPADLRTADYFGGWVHIPGQVKDGVFIGGSHRAESQTPDGPYEMLLRPAALELGRGTYTVEVRSVRFRGRDTLVSLVGEDGVQWNISDPCHPELLPGMHLKAAVSMEGMLLFQAP